MTKLTRKLRIGTRGSKLAKIQTNLALAQLTAILPGLQFETIVVMTAGDLDLQRDLRTSPDDFFSRALDEAILSGDLDAAVHSAKDLPDEIDKNLDWFWMPEAADPRDVLVLRKGISLTTLPSAPVVGVSSSRREEYIRKRFPNAVIKSVRGAIDDRIRQLDAGDFDILPMAAAGLIRLGLSDRITEWIDLSAMPVPEGQGHLAITFRADDPVWQTIRSMVIKPVIFAGAGCTRATCTLDAWHALNRCDICFHDTLLDPTLFESLPASVTLVNVGKRSGHHTVDQTKINNLILQAVRRGHRVVRLKGGDPGIFGRLTEEIDSLENFAIPYRVIPGVSSLQSATTGTGLLLTIRGESRGFTVMTPRVRGGEILSIQHSTRQQLPLILFMATGILPEIVGQLIDDGYCKSTPVNVVFEAGSPDEEIISGTLADIADTAVPHEKAGLIIIGKVGLPFNRSNSPLQSRRILLPGSEQLRQKGIDLVYDYGGIPVPLPLIKAVPLPAAIETVKQINSFDCVILSSPTAAHILIQVLREAEIDLRRLPKIMVAGQGTAAVFNAAGLNPDFMPSGNFGSAAILELASKLPKATRILRLRSDLAGTGLAESLRAMQLNVEDCPIYTNHLLKPAQKPAFDAVFFASASAVKAYCEWQEPQTLSGKLVVAIGSPTQAALLRYNVTHAIMPAIATTQAAIQTIAAYMVSRKLEQLS